MEEISLKSIAVSLVLVTVVTWAWRVLNWVWFRPKKLERYLRQQGLSGKPYRFLSGDMKEMNMMIKEVRSIPMNFTDEIPPRLVPFHYKLAKAYGKTPFFVWHGPTPSVTIMDPDQIKEVLTRSKDFTKPPPNPLSSLLALGIAQYEGEKWSKHRRIVNPAFHQEKLKLMLPAFYQCCDELISKWEKLVSVEGSYELDVWPELLHLTSDVISRAAFGSNYEEGKRIFELQDEQFKHFAHVVQHVYIPGWRHVPTKRNKRMKEIDKEIRASLMSIIKNKERALKAGEATKDDLLGILLESNFRETAEHGNNKNVGLTMDDVIEECKLFYLAGQTTSTVLLVWTMILLSMHQNWQARAREEVLQVFGEDEVPNFDGLNRLKVVSMIIFEVLRLYPPGVFLIRYVPKEVKLGNISLPAGVEISLPVLLSHHDEDQWGQDAKEFNPERFSEGISKATKSQGSYCPFGLGPRICIGQNFALLEAKMALALMLRNFAFELSPNYVHAPFVALHIHLEHGAKLTLKRL